MLAITTSTTPDVLLALEDRIRALLTDRGEMTLASIVQELHAHGDWRQVGVTMLAMRDRGEIEAAWLGVVPLTVFSLARNVPACPRTSQEGIERNHGRDWPTNAPAAS